jgi:serine/threonine protein kinase
MPDPAPLAPGDPASLGSYQLVGRLGAGGQGTVFLGRDADGERVAIKSLHGAFRADPAARARMGREVMAAQRVEAFCTARVLDYDIDGEHPYIVSEYIDGPSLHEVVSREGPRVGPVLDRLAIGTATALAAIHQHGIVHRDFKPANVLIGPDGPRVVDFGIARAADLGLEPLTAVGAVIGTPGFLAPEQLAGEPPGPAVDIFAWGTTMIFAATGRMPGRLGDRPGDRPPDLTGLAGTLRALVERCLATDPDGRPEAHDILLDLLGDAGGPPASGSADDILDAGTRLATRMTPARQPDPPLRPPSSPPFRPPRPPRPPGRPPWPVPPPRDARAAPRHHPPAHRPPARGHRPPARLHGPHASPHGAHVAPPHPPGPRQGRPTPPGRTDPRPGPTAFPRPAPRPKLTTGGAVALGCVLLFLMFAAGCLVLGAAMQARAAGRTCGAGPAAKAEVGSARNPTVTPCSLERGNQSTKYRLSPVSACYPATAAGCTGYR